ncbi:electron transfer flavoprotein subunit alpha/FixB family protein [Geopsychrobacter electrodiphilus]|uniref:electron transfer flavoprotein subunit alpha/FixB family protein n=1 Tax=Geopsychrobacter electrodiphilus TaxID=225196 RepID=UPI000371DD27|nr:electron transfer flavoprotein subunit alpha/FixB family protein [Geopsychrobacter electrodiphilus]
MSTAKLQHAGQQVKILVFVDLPQGELDDFGKGILSEASRLARTLAADWSVLSFAGAPEDVLQAMAPYGVDKLTLIDGPEGAEDSLELQGRLIAAAARAQGAALLLLPHNDLGGALAPLLAAELDAALLTETIATRVDGNQLVLSRRILGQQIAESKTWDGSGRLVLTVHPRVLSSVVLPSMQTGKMKTELWQPAVNLETGGTRIIERIPADPLTVDVSEAQVMVSAGLGCNPKSFAQVEELTRLLNASLGVTRPAYDLGYTGFERMVGQTGKTVAPRFYLALGISGSMHHLGGIKDSRRVVAVNIDAKAPIVPNSDETFVADLREVLPLLIERLKTATGEAA